MGKDTNAIDMPPPQSMRRTSFDDFRSFMASPANHEAAITAFETRLLGTSDRFTVSGHCEG
jgi:hypothetical protein